MAKVSVIIPIYGVEKYIERCAVSLFEQTLDDIEYIFVDDCTPDNSILILRKVLASYPYRAKQVRILHHQHNLGLPQARQTGIKVANGEYIAHWYSDDWLDIHMYEEMYKKAKEKNADIVFCDYYSSDGTNQNEIKGLISTEKESIFIDILSSRVSGSIWNKLIKKDVYTTNSILFPTSNMGEDAVILIQLLWYSIKITYLKKPYYYYFYNQDSITNNIIEDKIRQRFLQATNNANIIQQFIIGNSSKKIDEALVKYIYEQLYLLLPLVRKNKSDLKLWAKEARKIQNYVYRNPYLTLKNKLLFYLLLLKNKMM